MKYLFLSLALVAISFTTQAQESNQVDPSIDAQFKELIEGSNNFKEYKVVKEADINNLRKNANESIQKLKENITTLESSITTKDSRIATLENELAGINTQLSEVNAEKDSMNFLGIQVFTIP